MDKMASRERKKVTQRLGNHPGVWLTDTERFRTVSRQLVDLRELSAKIDAALADGLDAWMAKEAWLMEYCRQLTCRLHDRLPPAVVREMKDPLEWTGNPELLSGDSRCWGFLGALDAVSALYVMMVTSRMTSTSIDRAMQDLMASFSPYRARSYALYSDVQKQCVSLCPDAEPASLYVSIGEESGCPLLEITYQLRLGTED